MEPSASIAIIETDLRRLVRVVSSDKFGTEWRTRVVDEDTAAQLTNRYVEKEKRRAPAKVSDDLLDYTHLHELRKVIEREWEAFSPALGKLREFSILMDKVEDFRNAPAHSRELLPHERSLLEGIAGTIRTQVTAYVSSRSSDLRHYPIIESVRDSFGNQLAVSAPGQLDTVDTGLELQVGTAAEFEARGWDPQGRELTWDFGPMVAAQRRVSVMGTEAHFSWSVTEEDVGANFYFQVTLSSSGPFHRFQGFDQRLVFRYGVEPPSAPRA